MVGEDREGQEQFLAWSVDSVVKICCFHGLVSKELCKLASEEESEETQSRYLKTDYNYQQKDKY